MEMMATSTLQLRDVASNQNELAESLTERSAQVEILSARSEDLERRLKQEQEAREYLALELNKAEGKPYLLSHSRDTGSPVKPASQACRPNIS